MRIGIGHKTLFAANSMAIDKKSNAVDCPSPGPRRPQGVMQRFLNDTDFVARSQSDVGREHLHWRAPQALQLPPALRLQAPITIANT